MRAEADGEVRRSRRGLSLQYLRRWLLAGALVLAAVVAGFIGYARQRGRRAVRELPHLLGADIRSVTDGFTYSQTVKGRTLFTIHAAKAIQRESGKTTLHDVSVTLYGEPGSNRTDSIRGAEFEYDQPNGVVRAMGETQLDLALPATGSGPQSSGKRMIVTTRGLVFLEKLGVAATDEQVRFQYGTLRGQSVGADYDADTGLLQLHHDVHLQSQENGHLEKVDAGDAVLDRAKRTALLHGATIVDAADQLRAQTIHIDLRPEGADGAGSIQQVHAEGNVELGGLNGTKIRGAELVANFTQANRPKDAVLSGGVNLTDAHSHGTAAEARATFDAEGRPAHIDLLHEVHLFSSGALPASTRQLTAQHVSGDLLRDGAQHATLQNLVATGNARLQLINGAKSHSARKASASAASVQSVGDTTVVTAAVLRAFGSPGLHGSWELRRLEGEGTTEVNQTASDGSQRLSRGEHLLATFAPEKSSLTPAALEGAATQAGGARESLQSVVQQGHVEILEKRPAVLKEERKPGSAAGSSTSESRATADRVEYTGATEQAVLTGSPVVNEPGMQVSADRVTVSRTTGDAEAQGHVKGSYAADTATAPLRATAQAPPKPVVSREGGPIHFLAERAVLLRRNQMATLYGAGVPARLWSASAQLEAPVMDLLRAEGSIHAHSAAGSTNTSTMVRAVLPAATAGVARPPREGTGLIRILSSDAVYVQATANKPAEARFSGGARMLSAEGTMTANQAVALFQSTPRDTPSAILGSGAVRQIVAEGKVSVQQPGRTATGDRLLYTAADQRYELTGTSAAPPSVRDSVQGTITGASLIFHSGDDSVEVAGAPNGIVHTDALVPERTGSGRPKLTPPRKVPGRTPGHTP